MKQLLAISHALMHPKRVRMLAILQGRELCACHIARALRLSKADALENLKVLTRAGLITLGQAGQWSLYRPITNPPRAIRMAIFWTLDTVGDDPRVREDIDRLRAILSRFPLERCRRGNENRPYGFPAHSAEATKMGEAMPPIAKRMRLPNRRFGKTHDGDQACCSRRQRVTAETLVGAHAEPKNSAEVIT